MRWNIYKTTNVATEASSFSCGKCGYSSHADAQGYAEATSILSGESAAWQASVKAKRRARAILSVAACPHCGWRSPKCVRRFHVETVFFGALIATITAFYIDIAIEARSNGTAWFLGIIGAGWLIGHLVRRLEMWWHSEDAVYDPEKEKAQAAAKFAQEYRPCQHCSRPTMIALLHCSVCGHRQNTQ